MNGKSKCKILKDIRRQIAAENDIEFVTSECEYRGECPGTCPKCEAEVRYLERELAKRQMAGKVVTVAGITAAIMVGTAGCMPSATMGEPVGYPETSQSAPTTEAKTPETTLWDYPLMGVPVDPDLWD